MKFDSGDYLGRKRNLRDRIKLSKGKNEENWVFILGKPQEELNGLMNKTKQHNKAKPKISEHNLYGGFPVQ